MPKFDPEKQSDSASGLLVVFGVLVFVWTRSLTFESPAGVGVHPFNLAHYFFSYEHEFLKRSLIGEIFRLTGAEISAPRVWMLSLSAGVLLTGFLVKYFQDRLRACPTEQRTMVTAIVLSSPAVLMHFAYDSGRFDLYNYVLLFACLFLLDARSQLARWCIIGVCICGTLIHEGFLVAQLASVLLPIMAHRYLTRRRDGRLLAGLLCTMLGLVVVIAVWGAADLRTQEQWVETLVASGMGAGQAHTVSNVLFLGLRENATFVLWAHPRRIFEDPTHYAISGALALAYASWFAYAWRAVWRRVPREAVTERRSLYILLLGPIAMLPLFILGIDIHRFTAATVFNMLILIGYLGELAGPRFVPLPISRRFAVGLVLFSLLMGPMGNDVLSLPAWFRG